MWPAIDVVVVTYGFVVVVGVSAEVPGPPGVSVGVDPAGPGTTGLSWLVCTLGTE
jgi:hypothetical protein